MNVIAVDHEVHFLTIDVNHSPKNHSLTSNSIMARQIINDGCAGAIGVREKVGMVRSDVG